MIIMYNIICTIRQWLNQKPDPILILFDMRHQRQERDIAKKNERR